MAARPSIAIVGPGRLGTALAIELSRAGYRIREIVWRDLPDKKTRTLAKRTKARASSSATAALDADLVWFCVPDREIAQAADAFANRKWENKVAFHSSGALTSDELRNLKRRGAATASVHPLMTFVREAKPSLSQVPFAMEGDRKAVAVAQRMVRDLGGEPFRISKKNKAAYHAWGTFASPLLIALLATTEQVAPAAGVSPASARKRMLPILRQTLANYAALGPAGAFSGPMIRGDVDVVRKHMQLLRRLPEANQVYVALARSALKHLPAKNRAALTRLLKSQ